MRACRSPTQLRIDPIEHPCWILQHLDIPKSQHPNPLLGQKCVTREIMFPLFGNIVNVTVQFHRHSFRRAIEIYHIRADRILPTKLELGKTPIAKPTPERSLSPCRCLPQSPSQNCVSAHSRPLTSILSPRAGERRRASNLPPPSQGEGQGEGPIFHHGLHTSTTRFGFGLLACSTSRRLASYPFRPIKP